VYDAIIAANNQIHVILALIQQTPSMLAWAVEKKSFALVRALIQQNIVASKDYVKLCD
jgi:hypothetical protein